MKSANFAIDLILFHKMKCIVIFVLQFTVKPLTIYRLYSVNILLASEITEIKLSSSIIVNFCNQPLLPLINMTTVLPKLLMVT